MACPSCLDKNTPRPVEKWGPYRLVRCTGCDLVYSVPMKSSETYYREAADWEEPPPWRWEFSRFLEEGIGRNGRLLDIGCGYGFFSAEAQKRGYRVTAVEPNPKAVEFARVTNGVKKVHAGSLDTLPRTGAGPHSPRHRGRPVRRKGREYGRHHAGPFDVITCFHVLEHVEDPRAFLARIRSLLRGNGHLALGVPNPNRWTLRIRRDFGDCPPIHLTRWNRSALTRALRDSGFEIKTVEEERTVFKDRETLVDAVRTLISLATSTGRIAKTRLQSSGPQPAGGPPRGWADTLHAMARVKSLGVSALTRAIYPVAGWALRGRSLPGPGLYVRAMAS